MTILMLFLINFTEPAMAEILQFKMNTMTLKSGPARKANGVCYIPKFSTQQSYIYEEFRRLYITDTEKIKERLSKQRKKYENILNDPKIKTSGFADEIAGKYFRTIYEFSKNKTAFFHAVYYKILLKEQRKHFTHCLQI